MAVFTTYFIATTSNSPGMGRKLPNLWTLMLLSICYTPWTDSPSPIDQNILKLSKLSISVSVIFTMEIPKQSEKSQIGLVFLLTRHVCIDSSRFFIVIVSWWKESLLCVGCRETGTKRVLLGLFGDCQLDHSFGCLNFYGILFQCLNTWNRQKTHSWKFYLFSLNLKNSMGCC